MNVTQDCDDSPEEALGQVWIIICVQSLGHFKDDLLAY